MLLPMKSLEFRVPGAAICLKIHRNFQLRADAGTTTYFPPASPPPRCLRPSVSRSLLQSMSGVSASSTLHSSSSQSFKGFAMTTTTRWRRTRRRQTLKGVSNVSLDGFNDDNEELMERIQQEWQGSR